MTTDQFNAKLAELRISHAYLAELMLLGGTELIQYWAAGKESVPEIVVRVLGIIEEQRAWL